MAVFQRNNAWWIDVYVNGNRIRRKIGPDKETAELALKDIQVRAAKSKWLGIDDRPSVTFADFCDEYLKYTETLSPNRHYHVSRITRKRLIPFFGSLNLSDITPKDIDDFKVSIARQLKPSTVNEYLSILRAILRLAVDWEFLSVSPIRKVKLMRVQKEEPPTLTVAEADRLTDACSDPRLHLFAMIGLHTGLRIGEIVNLTWRDIDLKRGILKVRPKKDWVVKDRDIRDVPLSDPLGEALARHPRHISSPYVLHRPGSPFMSTPIS